MEEIVDMGEETKERLFGKRPENNTLRVWVNSSVSLEYHKGECCPLCSGTICQEGFCVECQIFRKL